MARDDIDVTLIDTEKAFGILKEHIRSFGLENVKIPNSLRRILAEDWFCDRDMPPFDRVTMDGIAILFDNVPRSGPIKIESIAAAGDSQKTLVNAHNCIEVMTGSVLPYNCDTVIRYEDLSINHQSATIDKSFRKGQNVHYRGEDHAKGDKVVERGTQISSAEIGIAATIGKEIIPVQGLPKTLIISTGDELVDIHESPKAHQIRRSNVYRIAAALKHIGIDADSDHLHDNEAEIKQKLTSHLEQYDVIILNGGVSKGKYDYLPGVLESLSVTKHFHGIAQKPGKPFWFGSRVEGPIVFALPGNPVSSFMCAMVYVLPWIKQAIYWPPTAISMGMLSSDITFQADKDYFVIVQAENSNGKILLNPIIGNGSGDLTSLSRGNAFVRLPRNQSKFGRNEAFQYYPYR